LFGRGADVFLEADNRKAIPMLTRVIKDAVKPSEKEKFKKRAAQLADTHNKWKAEWKAFAENKAKQKPISADWLAYCINQAIDKDTIVVNHMVNTATPVDEQVERSKPGTLFGAYGCSFQWALPAALGAKVAAPDKTVVCLVSDGGFVWGCPTATLWSSRYYKAPFLTVIFNNQGYTTKPEWDIPNPPDYELTALACGAWARKVVDPADVLPSIKEGLAQVRDGNPAVLNVWLERRELF
jgi:acetolactate synthase-1/2/3 large subunit